MMPNLIQSLQSGGDDAKPHPKSTVGHGDDAKPYPKSTVGHGDDAKPHNMLFKCIKETTPVYL